MGALKTRTHLVLHDVGRPVEEVVAFVAGRLSERKKGKAWRYGELGRSDKRRKEARFSQ